ncbi:MAG: hypothetical protein M3O34_07490 [Chloroflexota bacterium]|nr:hypothetical protein [Chloroflexota bacterium]
MFSFNTGILAAQAQRELLIRERVGAVFLTTGQERALDALRLILNQWTWLETIDAGTIRPFAYLLTMGGKKSAVDLRAPNIHKLLRGR